MGVTTRAKNATVHPGLRARGDPDELAEAAARKEQKEAKQAQRVKEATEKSATTKQVARFKDEMQDKVIKEDGAKVERPRVAKGGRKSKKATLSVLSEQDTQIANNQADQTEAVEPTFQADPSADASDATMDDPSEVEEVKKKGKKKATARDEIEKLRESQESTHTAVDDGSESESGEDKTPRAVKGKAPQPRGKDKGATIHGIIDQSADDSHKKLKTQETQEVFKPSDRNKEEPGASSLSAQVFAAVGSTGQGSPVRAVQRRLSFSETPRAPAIIHPTNAYYLDTPAPAPRNGKSKAPANLMPSPGPLRVYRGPEDDNIRGVFDCDEESERQAAMASPLKPTEHRQTSSQMVGVKSRNAPPAAITIPAPTAADNKKDNKKANKKAGKRPGKRHQSTSATPKPKLEDLPPKIRDDWTYFGATYNAWAASRKNLFNITDKEACYAVEGIYYSKFGNRDAGYGDCPPFEERCPTVKYCKQYFNAYKNSMSSTAILALNAFFDHPVNAGKFDTMEQRRIYARQQLHLNRYIYKAFAIIDGQATAGAFGSSLGMNCFGVHFDKTEGADETLSHLCLTQEDLAPIGGLALAAAAVKRAFKIYAQGQVAFATANAAEDTSKPKLSRKKKLNMRPTIFTLGDNPHASMKQLHFSKDNYGGSVSDFAQAIEELEEHLWLGLLETGKCHAMKHRARSQDTSSTASTSTAEESQSRPRRRIFVVPNMAAYEACADAEWE
ncbi:hypothetical protein CERSUDRAFT_97161 [Gelatoporia subvermispora B]|uniref:Uncharacterized protein n=1 Tax=Ceriporiopsis subvermispora (strain B) TaxID=914234 RepID=M2R7A8_CERS8|nr:hypothetical protein CERSUDRAFT_97161 [Gelatoporia subvermispora B]